MDPLDQFFKQKMEERQFSFEEAYWRDAEQLIEARKERRRRLLFLWWWGFGLALLVLLSLGGWWYAHYKAPAAEPLPMETESARAAASPEAPSVLPLSPEREESPSGLSSGQDSTERSTPLRKQNKKVEGIPEKDTGPDGAEAKAFATQPHNNVDPSPAQSASATGEAPVALLSRPLESVDGLPSLLEELREAPLPFGEKPEWLPSAVRPDKTVDWRLAAALSAYPGEGENWVGGLLGMEVSYPLREEWALTGGLRYRLRGGTFGRSEERTRVEYRFGKTEERFQLAPERLHYLESQLMAQWDYQHHRLSVGLGWSYLLGIQGRLEQSVNPEFENSFGAFTTTEQGWLEKSGYNKQWLSLKGSYFYRLPGRWQVGMEWQYGPAGLVSENAPEVAGQPLLREAGPWLIDIGIKYSL